MHETLVDTPAVERPRPSIPFAFRAETFDLFVLGLKNAALTLITLGVYGAWARVAMLRALIEAVEVGGDRLRFHGEGGELFRALIKVMVVMALVYAVVIAWTMFVPDVTWPVLVLFYAAFVVIGGVAIFGAFRYRATRTSWRAVRFTVRPEVGEFLREYLGRALIALLSLGLYTPFFQVWLRGALVGRASLGTERFGFDGEAGPLVGPFLLSVLLTLPTLGLVWLWYDARLKRVLWNGTTLGPARFRLEFQDSEWFSVQLMTGLAVLLTLGLAWPWAVVRRTGFLLDHLALDGPLDLEAIRAAAGSAPATGEGLAELLNADFDLG